MSEKMETNVTESAPKNMRWKEKDLYLGEIKVGGYHLYESPGPLQNVSGAHNRIKRFSTSLSLPGNPSFGSLIENEDDAKKQVEDEVKKWIEKAGFNAK
jgi:hypothetical protein